MNKQPEVTARTRAALTRSFCGLLRTRPVEAVTVKEVAAGAGVSRCTFYEYFRDVYALRDEVEEGLIRKIAGALASGEGPSLDGLVGLFGSSQPEASAVLGPYGRAHFVSRLEAELPEGALAASLPGCPPGLAPYLLAFHLATTLSVLDTWEARGRDLAPDELMGVVHGLYTQGAGWAASREGGPATL